VLYIISASAMSVVVTKALSTIDQEHVNTTLLTEFQWEVHSVQAMLRASLHKTYPAGVKGIASPRFKIAGTRESGSLWIEGNVTKKNEVYKLSMTSDCTMEGELTLLSGGIQTSAKALVPEGERTVTLLSVKPDTALYAQIEATSKLCITARMKPLPRVKVVDTVLTLSNVEVASVPSLPQVLLNALSSPELQELADVEVVASDGETFQAHRQLLAMRSPVFRATFYCGMREAKSKRTQIQASGAAVKALLRYLYSDEVDFQSAGVLAGELLDLGMQYQLDKLVAMIHKHLLETMSIDNVAERLCLAIRYDVSKLQDDCVKIVRRNLVTVMATEGWPALCSNSEVMQLLLVPSEPKRCLSAEDGVEEPESKRVRCN